MLIATQFGLFSILQPRPDVFRVCGGSRVNLENLLALTDVEAVIETRSFPDGCCWVEVELEDVLEMMVQLSASVHYPDLGTCFAQLEGGHGKLTTYDALFEHLG